ncbi:MAG: hypothetical protein AAF708_07720 [Deinococcota bacterium]
MPTPKFAPKVRPRARPKLSSRISSRQQRSSLPMTETRVYLELYRISNEERRTINEIRDLRGRLAGLEQQLASLEQRKDELNAVLTAQPSSAQRALSRSDLQQRRQDTDQDGSFVLEY